MLGVERLQRETRHPITPGEARYFALAPDFSPGDAGLTYFAVARIIGQGAPRENANDLVVPTSGVVSARVGSFQSEQALVFERTESVVHRRVFASGRHGEIGLDG